MKEYSLVALAIEVDAMAVERPLVERHLNDLLLEFDLLALTTLAFLALFDGLAFSPAGITLLLNLLVHSRAHLEHLHHLALPLAGRALFDSGPAFARTLLTAPHSFVRHLDEFTIVALLESDIQGLLHGLGLLLLRGSSSSLSPCSSTEEHVHDI